jgi:hypothetical protein
VFAVVAVMAAAAGLFGVLRGSGPATQVGDVPSSAAATPSHSSQPSTPTTDSDGTFRVARVDRAGTVVTVFVSSPGACRAWAPGQSIVDERADRVVISVTGERKSVDCSRAIDTAVQVRLSQPLGERTVVDGRAQGVNILVVRDADLPVVPAPWWEVPGDYSGLDGSWFGFGYTTPGGPDLHFTVRRGPFAQPVLEQVRIGSHDAAIVEVNGQDAVSWEARELVYTMILVPSEGATTSREELDSVLAQLS